MFPGAEIRSLSADDTSLSMTEVISRPKVILVEMISKDFGKAVETYPISSSLSSSHTIHSMDRKEI